MLFVRINELLRRGRRPRRPVLQTSHLIVIDCIFDRKYSFVEIYFGAVEGAGPYEFIGK